MVWKNQKIKVMIFAIPTCIKYQQSFYLVLQVLCEVHFEKKNSLTYLPYLQCHNYVLVMFHFFFDKYMKEVHIIKLHLKFRK